MYLQTLNMHTFTIMVFRYVFHLKSFFLKKLFYDKQMDIYKFIWSFFVNDKQWFPCKFVLTVAIADPINYVFHYMYLLDFLQWGTDSLGYCSSTAWSLD